MRRRITYGFYAVTVIIFGLLSRTEFVPTFIYPYLGDVFYAILIYVLVAFLFVSEKPKYIAIYALIFCIGIECSQLYHATWIDTIRATRLGGLILGFGFLWTDLMAYIVGVGIGWCLEVYYLKPLKD